MSAWEEACRQHIEYTEDWDLSLRQNRRELSRWKRRLWWARYGIYVAVFSGATVGVTVTHLITQAFGWT